MPPATFRELAEVVGVSHATVSRALSGHPSVAETTRRKVLRAARQAGHPRIVDLPNFLELDSQRNTDQPMPVCIALIYYGLNEPSIAGTVRWHTLDGIMEYAQSMENISFEFVKPNPDEPFERTLQRLRGCDGVLLSGVAERSFVSDLLAHDIPVCLVSMDYSDLPVDCVIGDNFNSGRTAGRLLLDRGYRRIGWIELPASYPGYGTEWEKQIDGLRAEMSKAGLLPQPRDIRRFEEPTAKAYQQVAEQWFADGDLPEVIITPASEQAFIFLRTASRMGLQCPDDFGLLAFDECLYADMWMPLTLVRCSPKTMGRLSAARLVNRIRYRDAQNDVGWKVVVPTTVREGVSLKSLVE